jgi:hypothetical protein
MCCATLMGGAAADPWPMVLNGPGDRETPRSQRQMRKGNGKQPNAYGNWQKPNSGWLKSDGGSWRTCAAPLERLLLHLLKWRYNPTHNPRRSSVSARPGARSTDSSPITGACTATPPSAWPARHAGPCRCTSPDSSTLNRYDILCSDGRRGMSSWSPALRRWRESNGEVYCAT